MWRKEAGSPSVTQQVECCRVGHFEKKFSNQAEFRLWPGGLKVIYFFFQLVAFGLFVVVRRVSLPPPLLIRKIKLCFFCFVVHFAERESEVILCYHRLLTFCCLLLFALFRVIKGNHPRLCFCFFDLFCFFFFT